MKLAINIGRAITLGLGYFVGCCLLGWQGAAIWFDSPWPAPSLAAFLLVTAGALYLLKAWQQRLAFCVLLFLLNLGWWLQLAPSNNREWQADVAQLPSAEVNGSILTVQNVRNFDYRSDTDFTPRWETRSFDLSQLKGVDIFLSDWGATGIVHTIVSWDFGGDQHLAISIETRKETGETYSAVRGFFRQYELYYVVADERDLGPVGRPAGQLVDVIGVRARFRGEKLTLYHHKLPLDAARKLLLSYADSFNKIKDNPKWYNAFTSNCTTRIRSQMQIAGIERPLNWRLFANKYIDEMMYERGMLDQSLPFKELQARSDVTELAKSADAATNFATFIRQNLPK